MKKTIFVTGGTGYIGSHTVCQLLAENYSVIILDNLSNSKEVVLDRIFKITGKKPFFIKGDIRDASLLQNVFSEHKIDAVIHFAGLKAVGEGQAIPLTYYDNNISGSITLFNAMQKAGIRTILFSSSATIYGDPGYAKMTESTPVCPINVYGKTKAMVEEILLDAQRANPHFNIGLLRYFNPVGAHESGLIGEDPVGIPNNLMPYISQVAVGKREKLSVFGNDYDTIDGTGVRDYIHVEDLATAHVKAIDFLLEKDAQTLILNLGTGRPYSVLEVVHAFEKVTGVPIPYQIAPRRAGDVASCYADPSLAKSILNWQAKYDIVKMCEDSWRWQSQNPKGYEE